MHGIVVTHQRRRIVAQCQRSILDDLLWLLIEQIEARGKRVGSLRVEVIAWILIDDIAHQRNALEQVLLNHLVVVSHRRTVVVRIQRRLRLGDIRNAEVTLAVLLRVVHAKEVCQHEV